VKFKEKKKVPFEIRDFEVFAFQFEKIVLSSF